MYIYDFWNTQKNRNKNLSTVLQMASTRLLHVKINFSAHGLFPLDRTLLLTVIIICSNKSLNNKVKIAILGC